MFVGAKLSKIEPDGSATAYRINLIEKGTVVASRSGQCLYLADTVSFPASELERLGYQISEPSDEPDTCLEDMIVTYDGNFYEQVEIGQRYHLHARGVRLYALKSIGDRQIYQRCCLMTHFGMSEFFSARVDAASGEGFYCTIQFGSGSSLKAWLRSEEFTGLLGEFGETSKIEHMTKSILTYLNKCPDRLQKRGTGEIREVVGLRIYPERYWKTWPVLTRSPDTWFGNLEVELSEVEAFSEKQNKVDSEWRKKINGENFLIVGQFVD